MTSIKKPFRPEMRNALLLELKKRGQDVSTGTSYEKLANICISLDRSIKRSKENRTLYAFYSKHCLGKTPNNNRKNDSCESRKKFILSEEFYDSREWLAIRYKALQLHGARCMCCGANPSDGVKMHVDHIKPRSKFPELALVLDNLQILCEDCNLGKSNKDETDWRGSLDQDNDIFLQALDRIFKVKQ